MPKLFFTLKEAAEQLNTNRSSLMRRARERKIVPMELPHHCGGKDGGTRYRFTAKQIEALK